MQIFLSRASRIDDLFLIIYQTRIQPLLLTFCQLAFKQKCYWIIYRAYYLKGDRGREVSISQIGRLSHMRVFSTNQWYLVIKYAINTPKSIPYVN